MKEIYELKREGDLYTTEVLGLKFGFRKWTWGEKNSLTSECTITNPVNGFVTFDGEKFNEQMLLKTVFKFEGEAPKPFTIEEIRKLDAQLGERLFQITQKINLVSDVETKNL